MVRCRVILDLPCARGAPGACLSASPPGACPVACPGGCPPSPDIVCCCLRLPVIVCGRLPPFAGGRTCSPDRPTSARPPDWLTHGPTARRTAPAPARLPESAARARARARRGVGGRGGLLLALLVVRLARGGGASKPRLVGAAGGLDRGRGGCLCRWALEPAPKPGSTLAKLGPQLAEWAQIGQGRPSSDQMWPKSERFAPAQADRQLGLAAQGRGRRLGRGHVCGHDRGRDVSGHVRPWRMSGAYVAHAWRMRGACAAHGRRMRGACVAHARRIGGMSAACRRHVGTSAAHRRHRIGIVTESERCIIAMAIAIATMRALTS